MTDLCHSTTRQARKTYRCDLCGTTIDPGDQYTHQTSHTNGRFQTWRNCRPCDAVINAASGDLYETDGIGVTENDAQTWAEDHPDNPTATAYLERANS